VQRCRNEPDYPRLRLAQLLTERNLLREAEANFQALIDRRPDHPAAHLGLARLAGLRDDWNAASRHLAFALTNQATARSAYLLLAAIQLRQGNAPGAETARRVAAAQPPDQDWPDPFQTEAMEFKLGLRALVEQGQQLLQQNRLREAEEIATRLIETYPAAAEGWLYRGRIALVQNRLADATTALTRHLELEPNSVDGHQQMGVLLFRKQQEEESIRHFQEAIRLKPDALEAHYNLGLVERQRNRPREAMPAFQNAIRCQPAFIDAYLALAAAAEQSGQREEAAATLRQAMEVNPYDLRVQENLERLMTER
jgi:tetratricopeptide (TPR) repeat protein